MSEHDASPAGGDQHALDQLRRDAKLLLKQARARDVVALAGYEVPSAARTTRRRPVRYVDPFGRCATRRCAKARPCALGALKAFYQQLDRPVHAQAARFLRGAAPRGHARATALLASTPAIGRHSIHTAAAVGDAAAVQAFLDADSSLASQRDPDTHLEPLLAVQEELKRGIGVHSAQHVATVRALLDAGADPNTSAPLPDVSDTIPALYFPCVAGNVDVARVLLERGARPDDGESLYHAAQHDHEACLELLLSFGADIHRGPGPHGNTPLHFLVAHTPDNSLTPKVLRGVAWLLSHGANPNELSYPGVPHQPQAGETPLHRAAAVGHGEPVLRSLVSHGANVDLRRDDGATVYQLAVRSGNTSGAAYLAAVGAGTTLTAVDHLLGACLANDAVTARAVVGSNPGVLQALGPSERDALAQALMHGRTEAARLMVALGWPLTHEGRVGWNATALGGVAWAGGHGASSVERRRASERARREVRELTDCMVRAGRVTTLTRTTQTIRPLSTCSSMPVPPEKRRTTSGTNLQREWQVRGVVAALRARGFAV
ncbi:MAG: ankyrin repeat domain-containing protein [Gemmatimonadaceae bacterium]